MPTPATAPPSVIDFSCGTTAGIAPVRKRRVGQILVVVMPSASTQLAFASTREHAVEVR